MRIRLKASAIVSQSDDGYLLYDLQSGRLHHLNPAASLLVELCDGPRELDEIRDALLPLVGDEGWQSCRLWIDDAIRDGLIAPDDGACDAAPTAEQLSARANELWEDGAVLPAFVCQASAAELKPGDPNVWYTLGELAHIVGRRDTARRAYGRYLDQRPDDAEIAHLLISLRGEPAPERASDGCIEQLYARFANFYDETMTGDLEYQAPVLLRDAVSAALDGRCQLDVLDLGCGTGLGGESLRSFARRLVGMDLSTAMIDRARARQVYDALEVGEITTFLQTGDSRFDLIAACDTLIYFGELGQVLLPAAARLNPGGLIAFTLERGDVPPFALTDSGRFAHHADHVRSAAEAARLSVHGIDEGVLRYEYGNPVPGLVAVLKKR